MLKNVIVGQNKQSEVKIKFVKHREMLNFCSFKKEIVFFTYISEICIRDFINQNYLYSSLTGSPLLYEIGNTEL